MTTKSLMLQISHLQLTAASAVVLYNVVMVTRSNAVMVTTVWEEPIGMIDSCIAVCGQVCVRESELCADEDFPPP